MERFDNIAVSNTSTSSSRITTTTTVARDEDRYNMNHINQGFAYIFSHDTFPNNVYRDATDVDEKKIKFCLNSMGFDVQLFKNLKVAEIKYEINKARQLDHSDSNCFLLFVLSHGDENKVEASDGTYNPTEVLWNQFTADKCPNLAGKPKLFFMQCCQGEKLDHGTKLVYKQKRTETDGLFDDQSFCIPNYSDFCIMYASAKGHFAFRNEKKGSYFVRCVCEELEKHAYSEHLLTILTFVIRRVAVEFESKTRQPDRDKKKQVPYFESSLTRLIQFTRTKKEE